MSDGPERTDDVVPHEQLALVRQRVRRSKPKQVPGPASERPVARVLVDVSLAHLDRTFDYLVRADMDEAAQPGCRVKVRFAGQQVSGYITERAERTSHEGRLAPITRVVSPQPVLRPEIARLSGLVADYYAGVRADVLRLAVPPRHARVEKEFAERRHWRDAADLDSSRSVVDPGPVPRPRSGAGRDPGPDTGTDSGPGPRPDLGAWAAYPAGRAFLDRLRHGDAPRAVWEALPGSPWPQAVAEAVGATLASGRGSLVCVPDQRDVRRVAHALEEHLAAAGTVAVMTADAGPAARYRAFLRVVTGECRVVVGTRSAAFAPVHDLGLVVVWDDGDDLHAEARAPYPHAREVLTLRAGAEGTAMLLGGYARTAEAQLLVESGWAHPLTADREQIRAAAPRVHVTGETDHDLAHDAAARAARLPHQAFEVAREALRSGPVLVQVPRAGYLPSLACVTCHRAARCQQCQGPLTMRAAQRVAHCPWCGRAAWAWRCAHCGAARFRAPVVGSERTAEELGRAFPGARVVSSSGNAVRDAVDAEPALVVATPGAEPVAEDGYAAALILDTWLTLSRPALRVFEEAVRRWFNAVALVRPAGAGGRVVVVGEPATPAVQALVRWDPAGAAGRELAERRAARLPPAACAATVSGPSSAISDVARSVRLPPGGEVLGPLPLDDESSRIVLRVPRERTRELSAALTHMQASRSSRKQPHLRVQVDPYDLG